MLIYGTKEQQLFAYCTARNIGLFCGRRYGKTFGFRLRAIVRCSKPGFRYLYLAPTHALCLREFLALRDNPGLRQFVANHAKTPYPKLEFCNGSSIKFRNMRNPGNIRGNEYDEINLDEIQHELYTEDNYYSILRPLIASTFGTAVVMGQFRGENWYHDEFYKKALEGRYGYAAWRYPTREGLIFGCEEGKRELKDLEERTPSAIFRREYDCIPEDSVDGVFDPAHIDKTIKKLTAAELAAWQAPKPGKVYVLSIDLGGKVDPTGVVVLECERGEVQKEPARIVLAENIQRGLDCAVQALQCRKIADKYNAKVIIDSTGGATGGHVAFDTYTKEFQKLIPDIRAFYWGKGNKEKIVRFTDLEIQKESFFIPDAFKNLVGQLKKYSYQYNPRTGFYTFNAPTGEKDDQCTAFMVALWARYNRWFKGADNGAGFNAGLLG